MAGVESPNLPGLSSPHKVAQTGGTGPLLQPHPSRVRWSLRSPTPSRASSSKSVLHAHQEELVDTPVLSQSSRRISDSKLHALANFLGIANKTGQLHRVPRRKVRNVRLSLFFNSCIETRCWLTSGFARSAPTSRACTGVFLRACCWWASTLVSSGPRLCSWFRLATRSLLGIRV